MSLVWTMLSIACLASGHRGGAQEACFACHPAPGLAKRIAGFQHTSPEAEAQAFKGEAHATLKCADCHTQANIVPHPPTMHPTSCQTCHLDVRAHVVWHADSQVRQKLPRCEVCHGYHNVLRSQNVQSPVSRRNVVSLCTKCHEESPSSPRSYVQSVHGQAHARDPSSSAAVCTDCHGAHPAHQGETLVSLVGRAQLATTCGRCHTEALEEYSQSVHAKGIAAGKTWAATCTDCHGAEHDIRSPDDPRAQSSALRISETCAKCHEDKRLIRTSGLPADRVATYRDSYHGIAESLGSDRVANCASCHGAHDIRPSFDLQSSVHPANLPATCGKCHGNVNENVARGPIHLTVGREGPLLVYSVALGFRWLTILVMSALIAHIALDLTRTLKIRRHARREDGRSGEWPGTNRTV